MSSEWVVFHPEVVNTLEAAGDAYMDDAYHATSRPPADRSARKWKLRNALVAADPRLRHADSIVVRDPETGAEETLPCLSVLDWDASDGVSLRVFDDAVEIHLPQVLHEAAPEAVVREALGYLSVLAREGFSVVYDADNDALIDPAQDFDALVARYRDTLEYFAQEEAENNEPASTPAGVADNAAPVTPGNFTGNVGEAKPWWKFW